jgi:hypothetical protein
LSEPGNICSILDHAEKIFIKFINPVTRMERNPFPARSQENNLKKYQAGGWDHVPLHLENL